MSGCLGTAVLSIPASSGFSDYYVGDIDPFPEPDVKGSLCGVVAENPQQWEQQRGSHDLISA